MTDLTIDTSTATALKGSLENLAKVAIEAKDGSATARAGFAELRQALDSFMAESKAEIRNFGATHGETKAKIEEVSRLAAEQVGKWSQSEQLLQKCAEQIKEIEGVVERQHQELKRRGGDDAEVKARAALNAAAREVYEVKASEKTPLDPKKQIPVSDEDVAHYGEYKSALDRMMRLPTSVGQETMHMHLSQPEQKAVSTFTHGNRFWLPTEMSNMIIACYKLDTDLTGLVSQTMISSAGVEFMVDTYVSDEALFKCELDCAPKGKVDTQLPGTILLRPYEMFASECVTHTMIEDAAIDIQGFIAQRAGRQFIRGLNNKILNGTGQEMPDGILRPANHNTMQSGIAGGTPTGAFGWQDLRTMTVKLEPRFQAGAVWIMTTDAIAACLTMTDGLGKPILGDYALHGTGLPVIMGKPVVQVVQMASSLQNVANQGPFVPGSKPILLGDWKQHYMMVIRRGFTAFRNPYINSKCGVTWEFFQRVGGGVLCKNAAMALEIK